jgi:hypothetical protein
MCSTMLRSVALTGALAAATTLCTTAFPAAPGELRPTNSSGIRPILVARATRDALAVFAAPYGDPSSIAVDTGIAIPEDVATDLARRINTIRRLTRRLGNDEGFLRNADETTLLLLFDRERGKGELLRAYGPSFGTTDPPPSMFSSLDRALDSLLQEITRLAPTYASPGATPGGHPLMKALADALELRLRAVVPEATFVGGTLRDKEWRVRLSALGLPESRTISGVLFYRIPDQPWLICREFEIAQRYFKRSSATSAEITFGCLRLQANA